MTTLTTDQLRQLNMYSIYTVQPKRPLFTLADLSDVEKTGDLLAIIQTVSLSSNRTVAASFFMRRLGMFYAIQFYNLAAYDEVWDGNSSRLVFGAIEEYGKLTVSSFISTEDWRYVEDEERREVLRTIIEDAHNTIQKIRTVSPASSQMLWENIFGFMLWQYHVLLENPGTSEEARADLDMLKDDKLWGSIANNSLFAKYLNGSEPSVLLNTVVRTTCCLSKDVPGLMQCGFCPVN